MKVFKNHERDIGVDISGYYLQSLEELMTKLSHAQFDEVDAHIEQPQMDRGSPHIYIYGGLEDTIPLYEFDLGKLVQSSLRYWEDDVMLECGESFARSFEDIATIIRATIKEKEDKDGNS